MRLVFMLRSYLRVLLQPHSVILYPYTASSMNDPFDDLEEQCCPGGDRLVTECTRCATTEVTLASALCNHATDVNGGCMWH